MPSPRILAALALVAGQVVTGLATGLVTSTVATPAMAQTPAHQVCARLLNWTTRHMPLPDALQNARLRELLTNIIPGDSYSIPEPNNCASVLQIMAQEGILGPEGATMEPVLGVGPECGSILPFVQQRYTALDTPLQDAVLRLMGEMRLPIEGPSNDAVACAILHGVIDRSNGFEVMQEF